MITTYSFDLYGNLLKIDTSEEMIDYGYNLIMPAAVARKDMNVELEINDKLWWGIIDDINRFPPDIKGNRTVHLFIHGLKPKYSNSELEEKDE